MWFKVAFGIAFVFAVTVAARTARRATHQHGGSLSQLAHEVRGLLAVRAGLGLVFYGALAAWLFWPSAAGWMYLPLPAAMRWLAVALLVPVLALFHAAFAALDTNYRGGVGLYADHTLVTRGPYRHIRHPIYAAFILLMGLVLLMSANWLLGLAGLLLVGSIALARIPTEERELRERFGRSWVAYSRQAGCLFPRFGSD